MFFSGTIAKWLFVLCLSFITGRKQHCTAAAGAAAAAASGLEAG